MNWELVDQLFDDRSLPDWVVGKGKETKIDPNKVRPESFLRAEENGYSVEFNSYNRIEGIVNITVRRVAVKGTRR